MLFLLRKLRDYSPAYDYFAEILVRADSEVTARHLAVTHSNDEDYAYTGKVKCEIVKEDGSDEVIIWNYRNG